MDYSRFLIVLFLRNVPLPLFMDLAQPLFPVIFVFHVIVRFLSYTLRKYKGFWVSLAMLWDCFVLFVFAFLYLSVCQCIPDALKFLTMRTLSWLARIKDQEANPFMACMDKGLCFLRYNRLSKILWGYQSTYYTLYVHIRTQFPETWNHSIFGKQTRSEAYNGTTGLKQWINPSEKLMVESNLALTHISSRFRSDTLTREMSNPVPPQRLINEENTLFISSHLTWKQNARNITKLGSSIQPMSFLFADSLYRWEEAYIKRMDDYFRLNIRIAYSINLQNTTHELAVDLYNITNRKNIFMQNFDPITGDTNTLYQFSFMPIVLYRGMF